MNQSTIEKCSPGLYTKKITDNNQVIIRVLLYNCMITVIITF